MHPDARPEGMITLVNRSSTSLYSGLIPALIAAEIKLGQLSIPLQDLANRAGVALIQAEITGLDLYRNQLTLQGRHPLPFDRLSLNLGAVSSQRSDDTIFAVPIKPLDAALSLIEQEDCANHDLTAAPFSVIGSGLAALEVAFALRRRWPQRRLILHKKPNLKLPSSVLKALQQNAIAIHDAGEPLAGPSLNCTGSVVPEWLEESGLPCDPKGRVRTEATLQVVGYPNFFAAGDCAVINNAPRPASGVWAVRAAKPLAYNLKRAIALQPLRQWKPQRFALQLLSGGNSGQSAWAQWGPFMLGPQRWILRWKQHLDQRFMQRLKQSPAMRGTAQSEPMLCRGCAAKLPASPLQKALLDVGLNELSHTPEDAAVIGINQNENQLLQSVDGFPALVSDPWLNSRIATLHACSDLWASGAKVSSAQAIVTIPAIDPESQQMLLSQTLAGVRSALDPQAASLLGGHTLEARSETPSPASLGIQVSLCVNGQRLQKRKPWSKRGLQVGDVLLLSRPLGTGVVLAAAMAGATSGPVLEATLKQLSNSQHELLNQLLSYENLEQGSIHACTDVTGFGLLGHMAEMLDPDRSMRIDLDVTQLPALPGALELLQRGFQSSLAPANRDALRWLQPAESRRSWVQLSTQDSAIESLLVDPQTCGPLLVACSDNTHKQLLQHHPWVCIGSVHSGS